MTKQYIKQGALAAMFGISLLSCDQDKDVASVPSLDNKSNITITRVDENAGQAFLNEGDTLEFEVTSDRMMRTGVEFSTLLGEATTLVEGQDYVIISGATIAPYTMSSMVSIAIISDDFPEMAETLNLDIEAENIAQNWQLHPSSLEATNFNYEVRNVNAPDAISVGFLWGDDHDDFDMYIYSVAEGGAWGENIYAAATGSMPEVTTELKVGDPDGTYYIGIDPYAVEHEVTEYTVSVGLDDGTVHVFNGTFDTNALENYEVDEGAYRLLEIVKTGATVTVTHVNE